MKKWIASALLLVAVMGLVIGSTAGSENAQTKPPEPVGLSAIK
ncbi:hypothetical protein [Tumebacillus lipolyticus]|uniref:Uncharacterized protein n=1 Tax=Tumebacillus lipolyticus TaxID=1280370 RepID=A0ABW4ZW28_9BACL